MNWICDMLFVFKDIVVTLSLIAFFSGIKSFVKTILITTSLLLKRSFWHSWFRYNFRMPFSWNGIYAKSNEVINGDNKINRRRDMPSNFVYARINESVMLNKSYITLLSTNKFLSNRFFINKKKKKTDLRRIFQAENQFKSFKNSMFEVLPHHMLILISRIMLKMRHIMSPLLLILTHNNCWRSRTWIKPRI